MDFLIWIAVLIGVAFLLGWVVSGMAKTQKNIVVRSSPAVLAETINGHFKGVWWTAVPGQGQFNFRARGLGLGAVLKGRPVLSIDVQMTSDRAAEVQVWMSEWSQKSGVVALADRVVLKRASLFRKLRTADTQARTG